MAYRTEIREHTEVVRKPVYIASDGTEFEIESRCAYYERNLEKTLLLNKVSNFCISELYNCVPLSTDPYWSDDHKFYWYEVHDMNEVHLLEELYDLEIVHVPQFPTVIYIADYNEEYADYYFAKLFILIISVFKSVYCPWVLILYIK